MKGDDDKDERDLAQEVSALARAIQPERDLWAGVAARIEAKRRRTILARRSMTAGSALLAAAAVFLVLRTAARPTTSSVAPAPIASERVPSKRLRPTVNLVGAVVVPEEKSYRSAIAALAPTFDEHLGALGENEAAVVCTSLDAISDAIETTRSSLEQEPDCPELRAELADEYEQEIQTMNDVLEWTTRS